MYYRILLSFEVKKLQDMLGLLLCWTLYFVLHSLLAADFFKAWVAPFWQGFYRLLYNGVAVLGFAGIWLFQRSLPAHTFNLPGSMIWGYSGIFLLISGLVVGVIALKSYDLGEFAGTSYLDKDKNKLSPELQTQGLNAWVRHPLYFATLLIIWGYFLWKQSDISLGVAGTFSIYLIMGSELEERKLIKTFGADYLNYKAKVKRLVPFVF